MGGETEDAMPPSLLGTRPPRPGTGAAIRLRRAATELKTLAGTTETDSRSRCRTAPDLHLQRPRRQRRTTPPPQGVISLSTLSRVRSLLRRRKPGYRPDGKKPAMTAHAVGRFALVAAGVVIIALTGGAFWLSYAHLADIAGQHGLGSSPIRRWAWPATLDAFIIVGELLMLRAGLRHVSDIWAIGVTAIGSIGSIALNVAGVAGTRNVDTVPLLDYVVAAVPPSAAMVAFAVLTRQIHELVEHPGGHPIPSSVQAPESSATTTVQPAEQTAESAGIGARRESPVDVSAWSPHPPSEVAKSKARGGRPPGAPLAELVEIGRAAAADQGKLTRAIVRKAIEDKELTIGSERLTEVTGILRAERKATANAGPRSD